MIKRFRAWDGEKYWYADKNLIFLYNLEALSLSEASFTINELEMFTGKIDQKRIKIYENDLIVNNQQDPSKIFQVIWSNDACGFRKVPHELPFPETKIDEAFMEVIGTIHSK